MNPAMLLGFAAISIALVAVPGPSVLVAVSRAIVGGRRYALLTVLGNATGLGVQVSLVAFGLGGIVVGSDEALTILRMAGAGYLVWLGVGAIRHHRSGDTLQVAADPARSTTPLRDGFVVGLTNPKSLVFLAALLPRYTDPTAGAVIPQMLLTGAVFCAIAVMGDGTWTLLAAHARRSLLASPRRLDVMAVAGGLVMVVLGLALAMSGP